MKKMYIKCLVLLLLSLYFQSCDFTKRDNYDPWITDEEACMELAKVSKALEILKESDWLFQYNWDIRNLIVEYAEDYLYNQCSSSEIKKYNLRTEKYETLENIKKDLNEEVLEIFNRCNAPSLDWSDLINDDYANYQVWLISKESDPERLSDIKITVFFNNDRKRTHLRLFHPQK